MHLNQERSKKLANFIFRKKIIIEMKKLLLIPLLMMSLNALAQNIMTPELLWKLGRVTPLGLCILSQ